MRGTALQSFLLPVEPAGKQVSPHSDTALPTAEKARIRPAGIFGCARETLQQAFVSGPERLTHFGVSHS